MPQELSKSCRSTPLVCSSIIVLLTRSRGLYDGEACAVRLYDNAHIVMIVVFMYVKSIISLMIKMVRGVRISENKGCNMLFFLCKYLRILNHSTRMIMYM